MTVSHSSIPLIEPTFIKQTFWNVNLMSLNKVIVIKIKSVIKPILLFIFDNNLAAFMSGKLLQSL